MSAESLLQNILRVARDFISDGLSALDALDELDMSVSRSISNIEVGVIGLDFMEALDHSCSCRCASCLRWWVTVGPDNDGKYGPFTEAEISAASHPAICKCAKCLQWYATMGPNEDGKYGPFTETEVIEATITTLREVDEDV